MTKTTIFRRHIALPQDHGSWVFILSPLFNGFFAGGVWNAAAAALLVAAMSAFLFRQPVTILVKVLSGRRPKSDLPAAWTWILVYGVVNLLSLAYLVERGFSYILYLALPGLMIFAWHLSLLPKRAERRQAGLEVVASGVLALAAPAALWVGRGAYDPTGWVLMGLVWMQSAASIVYAYLRLDQRVLREIPAPRERWKMGGRSLLYTSFNLAVVLAGSLSRLLPTWIFLPYLVQWAETLWGISHPAVRAKPAAIGVRQLVVSILFTVLFILAWGAG